MRITETKINGIQNSMDLHMIFCFVLGKWKIPKVKTSPCENRSQ